MGHDQKNVQKKQSNKGMYMCIGIGLGAAVGACIQDNSGSSIAMGMCLGMALGSVVDMVEEKIKRHKRHKRHNSHKGGEGA